jgi:hypothetical protein
LEVPIQAKDVVKEAVGFTQIVTDGDDIYWVESRPNEGNRHVVVQYNLVTQTKKDMTPDGFNARTLIYSYGGGALTVSHGVFIFLIILASWKLKISVFFAKYRVMNQCQ